MTAETTDSVGRTRPFMRTATIIALMAMFVVLGVRLWAFLVQGHTALGFADELDYGEGIVWQQALDLFTAEAFGPIDRFPAIVYHYTPFYHAVTAALSWVSGINMLAVGRAVSLAATVAIALFAGAIADKALPGDHRARARAIVVAGAALSVFCYWPVLLWAPLMRVDMLAVALSMGGLFLGIKALGRPGLIHAAAIAFVAAVYTKQTSITAPAALFLMLLWLRPKLAWRGIATAVAAGLAALAVMTWLTGGGFIRHVFLYNINRFEPARLHWMVDVLAVHALFFGVALRMMWSRLHGLRTRLKSGGDWRATLNANPADMIFLIAGLYFLLAWLMAMTVIKSGSNVNYFIEWLCALSVLIGIGLSDAADVAAGDQARTRGRPADLWLGAVVIPAALCLQAILMKPPSYQAVWSQHRAAELALLARDVRAATKPVISDDMVLLIRSGKSVVWEPAIFAELARTGIWDEKPMADRIRRGEFAFFVTVGERGDRLFDSRYNPAIADAMDAAYPARTIQAGFTIHRPASAIAPSQQAQP